jgi:hypothetical protein
MMTTERWIALLVIVATVACTLIVLALLEREGQSQPQQCMNSEEREYLRALTLKGIDAAYQDQIMHLFDIWMKDSHDQPKRAVNGTQIAISAHVRARNNAIKWEPPPCP